MNKDNLATAITQQCLNHLSKEVELLQSYITVSTMIHDNLGVSTEALEDENDPLTKLGKHTSQMEKERQQMTTAIAEYLKVPPQQATVRTLMETLDGENKRLLAEKRDELLGLESSIQQQNRTNSFLIRHTIDL
ncbi:MAG: flagellar export chaperone FlgN, partial [Pirellulaceae bacterium]|nr:flagellar export chaperone FlgN [Pirellulaceae bacterium]